MTSPPTEIRQAIIVPCSSRKTRQIPNENCAFSLPFLPQPDLETAWLERVSASAPSVRCGDLYAGRGMALARDAASMLGAKLYVASAGLGLVAADRMIPPYALYVGHRGVDAVAGRASGHFDPHAWWDAVAQGPYSQPLESVFDSKRNDVTLIALSQPYAAMLANDLERASERDLTTLRFFGWRLEEVLDKRLHGAIMPYDGRLDAVLPGTRSDFPQRALLHFTRLTRGISAPSNDQSATVMRSLAGAVAPERVARQQKDDKEVIAWLRRHASPASGVGRSLRLIRAHGIACEQRRFARLYRQAVTKKGAA